MACAISIVIALVGYISMSSLPIEQYPDIAPPTVRVSTSYTGADAQTIMKSVVQPIGGKHQWCTWYDLYDKFGLIDR